MRIKTGSWFAPIPDDHIRIGISRGTPRGFPAGFRKFKTLAPGPWFNSVSPKEYLELYNSEILSPLDPEKIAKNILNLAGDKIPVLCCYEAVAKIQTGEQWCHRHIASAWLEGNLGIAVEEVGAPENFDPWVKLRLDGVAPPTYLKAAA